MIFFRSLLIFSFSLAALSCDERLAAECAPCPDVKKSADEQCANRGAHDELAELDTRRPVTLQPTMAWHQKQNMMQHLVAIQLITDGLAKEDWAAVTAASKMIESSPQMQQMCQHMGAGAPGFTEMALEFHRRADEIGVAASAQNATAALEATSKTLQMCTGCHAVYRQEVVDADTWEARTGSKHSPSFGPASGPTTGPTTAPAE